jgi:hypothetical protein
MQSPSRETNRFSARQEITRNNNNSNNKNNDDNNNLLSFVDWRHILPCTCKWVCLCYLELYYVCWCESQYMERIQWQFAAISSHRYFTHPHYSYANALEFLKSHSLRDSRYWLRLKLFLPFRTLQTCGLQHGILAHFPCSVCNDGVISSL